MYVNQKEVSEKKTETLFIHPSYFKNQDRNNDTQSINFISAIQHGKAIVSEVTPSELLQMDIEDVKKVAKINELFDMISDTRDKTFGDIVKKVLKKD